MECKKIIQILFSVYLPKLRRPTMCTVCYFQHHKSLLIILQHMHQPNNTLSTPMVYSPVTLSSTQGTPSSTSAENISFLTRQNEERLPLVASMRNSLHAFLAGDLLPPSVIATEIDQVVEEDIEELDVSWILAMAAFKAEKF
ncbi:hypothetical protein Hanom_Chr14g01262211 [Helianthus anomalus]